MLMREPRNSCVFRALPVVRSLERSDLLSLHTLEQTLYASCTRATFVVSPGFTTELGAAANANNMPLLTLPFSYSWIQAEPPESSGGQLPREEPDAPWEVTDSTVERLNNWYFESGQLELRAEDGSVLLLDVDTGVPDTVLIALDNAVESDRFETSWAPWQPLLRLDAYPSERVEWVSPESRADPDPLSGPVIDAENAHALLDLIFGTFAGEGQREPLVRVLNLMNTLEPLETEHDRGVQHDLFACPGGGTAQAWRADVEGDESDTAMTRCSWSMEGTNLVNDDVDAVSVLTTDKAHFWIGDVEGPAVSIDGTLELVGPATGGHVLRAVVSTLSSDPLAGRFASGGLEISSDDGSALTLEIIESGTRIVARNLNGEFELATPWTSWQEHLSVADAAICEVR